MRGPLGGVAVLFDLDGTLIDTAADLGAALNHALDLAGLERVPLARIRAFIGHGAPAMIEKALGDLGVPADAVDRAAMLRDFLGRYEDHIADASRPFPGVLAGIEELRRDGAKIALCTNKRERLARLLIDRLDLGGHFDALVGGDTAGAAKPDPRPIRWAMDAIAASRGVLVGDSDTDIAAAANAGIPVLISECGYGPLERRADAFALLPDFSRLPALVRQAAGGVREN